MFSPSTLLEIRKELDSLLALRLKVEERIAALQAIQQPFDLGQALRSVGTNGNRDANPAAVPKPQTNQYASTGLRAAAIEVLKVQGPMRAPELARVLSSRGLENDGTTPLSTRVYNDLWRMSQKGLVELKGGVFSVK